MALTTITPEIGSEIVTYAYPESDLLEHREGKQIARFMPNFFDGILEECYPEGRDRVMLPFPCFRGSVRILGGASGGPVCNNKGRVFGVNCTGWNGLDDGYFARINEIIPLWVNDLTLDGVKMESISVKELIKLRQIAVYPPINVE